MNYLSNALRKPGVNSYQKLSDDDSSSNSGKKPRKAERAHAVHPQTPVGQAARRNESVVGGKPPMIPHRLKGTPEVKASMPTLAQSASPLTPKARALFAHLGVAEDVAARLCASAPRLQAATASIRLMAVNRFGTQDRLRLDPEAAAAVFSALAHVHPRAACRMFALLHDYVVCEMMSSPKQALAVRSALESLALNPQTNRALDAVKQAYVTGFGRALQRARRGDDPLEVMAWLNGCPQWLLGDVLAMLPEGQLLASWCEKHQPFDVLLRDASARLALPVNYTPVLKVLGLSAVEVLSQFSPSALEYVKRQMEGTSAMQVNPAGQLVADGQSAWQALTTLPSTALMLKLLSTLHADSLLKLIRTMSPMVFHSMTSEWGRGPIDLGIVIAFEASYTRIVMDHIKRAEGTQAVGSDPSLQALGLLLAAAPAWILGDLLKLFDQKPGLLQAFLGHEGFRDGWQQAQERLQYAESDWHRRKAQELPV
jgi:hypothetical protein